MLVSLLGIRAVSLLSDIMACGALLAVFYGLVRVSYTQTYGAWPHNRYTMFADFLVELFTNVVGAINKAKVAAGDTPILSSPQTDARDVEIARLRAIVFAADLAHPVPATHPLRDPPLPQGLPAGERDVPPVEVAKDAP